jgi:hypothetical protein
MRWSYWGKIGSKENKNTHIFARQVPKVYIWGIAPGGQGRYEGENPKALK